MMGSLATTWNRWRKRIAVIVGGAAIYLWGEVIFGVPVIAVSPWIGPWPAFLLMTPLYALIDITLGILALYYYEKRVEARKEESRLARWYICPNLLKSSG